MRFSHADPFLHKIISDSEGRQALFPEKFWNRAGFSEPLFRRGRAAFTPFLLLFR